MQNKPKVLFLSSGNSTRSQMAEGFLRTLAGGTFEAASAGIKPTEVNPMTVEVMREVGIDISHQKPKNVAESLKEHYRYVVTVCDLARERAPIFPFTHNRLHWSIPDPSLAGGSDSERKNTYRRVRDQIKSQVHDFLSRTAGNDLKQSASAMRAGRSR